MEDYLKTEPQRTMDRPVALVLTKADELKASERKTAIAAATEEAKKHTAALAEIQLTSALKGDGIPELRMHLAGLAQ